MRKLYTQDNPLNILNLSKYHFEPNSKTDMLSVGDGKSLPISSLSSGLQTITPLLALFDFYSGCYYMREHRQREENIDDIEMNSKLLEKVSSFISSNSDKKNENLIKQKILEVISFSEDNGLPTAIVSVDNKTYDFNLLLRFVRSITKPHSTSFFIEEPEISLYPTAQRDLINHMIESVKGNDHTLFITTHSPYLLTSINNLMYASEAGKVDK